MERLKSAPIKKPLSFKVGRHYIVSRQSRIVQQQGTPRSIPSNKPRPRGFDDRVDLSSACVVMGCSDPADGEMTAEEDAVVGKKSRIFVVFSLFLCLVESFSFAPATMAQVEPFYKDKTVKIIVGFGSGGIYDRWGRLLARHMPKHIPGRPDFVVQNMPGAGSLIAANYVYGVAKPDGLTLGIIGPALYFDQLVGRKEVNFDWTRFVWLGAFESTIQLLYIRSDSPHKTIEDLHTTTEPARCGASGRGSNTYYFPKLLEEALGLKFHIVLGYAGAPDIDLAIQKGEVHCRGGTIGDFFTREPARTWGRTGFVRVLVQGGTRRDPRLPDVPTIYELMDKHKASDSAKRLAKVVLSPDDLGRVVAGAPGIPGERVKALRESFIKTVSDPDFIAEARKGQLDPEPVNSGELESIAKQVMEQPPEIVERLKKLLGN